jgi:hypothetical protein
MSELCKKYNCVHWGPCRMATGTCYQYGQFRHFSKDCMGKGVAQKLLGLAQVYALIPKKPEGGSEVVTCTTPILGKNTYIYIYVCIYCRSIYIFFIVGTSITMQCVVMRTVKCTNHISVQ